MNLEQIAKHLNLTAIAVSCIVCFTLCFTLCCTTLYFGVYVWPTAYRYEKMTTSYSRSSAFSVSRQTVYKINRRTGEIEKIIEMEDPLFGG